MPQSYADDLLATYFTDVEDLRDLFKAYLAAPELPKRHPRHPRRWRHRQIVAVAHVPPALQEYQDPGRARVGG